MMNFAQKFSIFIHQTVVQLKFTRYEIQFREKADQLCCAHP